MLAKIAGETPNEIETPPGDSVVLLVVRRFVPFALQARVFRPDDLSWNQDEDE